jgi:hypothetical protein
VASLINYFVAGGSVAIKVNEDVGRLFQTLKGFRQGDPLSPMLFNIVADMFAIMTEQTKVDGLIEGVIPHLVDGGLFILQYADDTIFMEYDLEKSRNLKLILEQLSGLKLTFIIVSCFVLVRRKTRSMLTPTYLGMGRASFL